MDEQKQLIGVDYSIASQDLIEILLEDVSEPEIFGEIARANVNRPEILQILYAHSGTPEDIRIYVSGILQLPVQAVTAVVEAEDEQIRHMKAQSLTTKIQTLNVSERIKLAMKGGREIRGILIRDANKQVMVAVLENQKITETEIENIARNRSTPDEILRMISKNREWMKSYSIVNAMVNNPKTPPGISVGLVTTLKTKDIVVLERNKNVPELVRSAAKRALIMRKPK